MRDAGRIESCGRAVNSDLCECLYVNVLCLRPSLNPCCVLAAANFGCIGSKQKNCVIKPTKLTQTFGAFGYTPAAS